MKKPRSSLRKPLLANRAAEQAQRCCEHIETVAGLLEACGRTNQNEPLEAQLVANTGTMIGSEAARLRQLLRHTHGG